MIFKYSEEDSAEGFTDFKADLTLIQEKVHDMKLKVNIKIHNIFSYIYLKFLKSDILYLVLVIIIVFVLRKCLTYSFRHINPSLCQTLNMILIRQMI